MLPNPTNLAVCTTNGDVQVPHVNCIDYQLIDISDDGFVSLLTENGNTKDDLKLPTDDALLTQSDISGLVSQLQELQKRNGELDEENKKLSSELHSNKVDNDMLRKRVNDLEREIPTVH